MNAELLAFVVQAKARTWNGNATPSLAYRPGSRDLQHHEADLAYMDSYFGSSDFLGQEVVWQAGVPIWAMNYHGQILRPDLYDGARAGQLSQFGRGKVYDQGTFLGEHNFVLEHAHFRMSTIGDPAGFSGSEWHEIAGVVVYRFDFHGGMLK